MLQRRCRYFLWHHLKRPLTACCFSPVRDDREAPAQKKQPRDKTFLMAPAESLLSKYVLQAGAFYVKYSPRPDLYSGDENTSLCFPHTNGPLWKCQRPHQKRPRPLPPLLLWCVVPGPSKTPHYWLMEPHQLHSIKTQRRPHAGVSPGLSEQRWAATNRGCRLLTSSRRRRGQLETPALAVNLLLVNARTEIAFSAAFLRLSERCCTHIKSVLF